MAQSGLSSPHRDRMRDFGMSAIFHINKISLESLESERYRTVSTITSIVPEHSLYEVGSTAVDGVIGKQDLDFLVRVPLADFLSTRTALDKVFARNPDQLSNDVYQGYTVESVMDVAIQLMIEGGPYDNFLTFLAELQASADLRQKYNELKVEFDGLPMSEYRDAKHEFIERVLAAGNEG